MEIPILTILTHASIIIIVYYAACKYYQYILHPDYRWYQRGNVCYSDRRDWAITATIVILAISYPIYYGWFKILFK